jgi:hypothetical protein
MRRRDISAAIVVLAAVAGCASLKDNYYLVKNLDDSNKSIALTNQGVDAYENLLIQQAAYDQTPKIRQYFVVALRYDPQNAKAQQYLDKVDSFKSNLVSDKLQTVDKLLAKPKRKDDENYTLIVALQTAVAIDPANSSAAKLLKDNASVQTSLVETYLAQSKEAMAKASDPAAADNAREGFYLTAYDAAAKATVLAPANAVATKQKAAIKVELEKAYSTHAAAASKSISLSKFEDAKAELGRANALNAKLDRGHSADISAATYSLYFNWAKSLESKGSNQDALDKLDQAISAKKSDEALALKKKIESKATAKAASVNQEQVFDAALPEIDKLIAKGDLLGANKRIAASAKITKDKARLDQLDPRRAKIASALKDLYDKGVADYRAENFKGAIEALNVVTGIDPGYEQAADFLGKAKEKQKLLDQYSN